VPGDDDDDEQGCTDEHPYTLIDPDSVRVTHVDSDGRVTDRSYTAGYRDGLHERSTALDETRRGVRDLRTAGALLALGLALLALRALARDDDEGVPVALPRLRD
jgi:hypothetical protein